ncbi:MAG: MFS transporter, partial [Sphingomonas sp.]
LLRNRVFRCLALGSGFHTFVTYGQGNWTAPFLGRVHGMSSGEIGSWLALLSIGPALVGMLAGGWLADRLARVRPHGRIEIAIASIALMIPFEIGGFGARDATIALIVFIGTFFFAGVYLPATIAEAHAHVPARTRASASALLMLSINLIGLGLGPLVAGVLSDRWAGLGAEGLRYALLALIPAQLLALVFFLRARAHARRARGSA